MVEKNSEKPCHLGSHGHNHHKPHVSRSKISKSAPLTHFQTIAPINVKHRKHEVNNVASQENSTKSSNVAIPRLSPIVARQGSPNYSMPRLSPSKEGSPRTSPSLGGFYAGAKFSEPPSPAALPKPPMHWTSAKGIFMATGCSFPSERADMITGHLKMLLNVSAWLTTMFRSQAIAEWTPKHIVQSCKLVF